MVSIVPDFGRLPVNELAEVDITLTTRKTLRLLRSAGMRLALGATDFSMNADAAGTMLYLQVQLTLFAPSKEGLSDRNLRQALNTSGTVIRPMRIQKFDGDKAGLAYALKYEFILRKSYFQNNRADGRACRNTRNQPLRGEKWMAMMVLLDRIGLYDRMALLGAKRTRQNGMMSMRLIE